MACHPQPGVPFEPAEQARHPGAAADAADVDLTKSHRGTILLGRVLAAECRYASRLLPAAAACY